MCLLSLAFNAHPDYPLIFVGNRDEYHARPTAAADWWTDAPDVLGGRDLEAGGTWLALNRRGDFGVVTNRPDLPAPDEAARSRGELIPGWLQSPTVPVELDEMHLLYGGFSLLLLSAGRLRRVCGGNGFGHLSNSELPAGISGLSNTAVEQPWPKLNWLNGQLQASISADRTRAEDLLELLLRRDPVPDAASHGVPATPFIVGDTYGTRSCSVVTIGRDGQCRFVEQRYGPGGRDQGTTDLRFRIEA